MFRPLTVSLSVQQNAGKYCIHIFFSSLLSKDAVAAGDDLFDTHRKFM